MDNNINNDKIRVLRILNRNNLGGPVLNAIFLHKFLSARFETKLICGNIASEETSANHLFEQYGVEFESIPGMERNINPLSDYKVYTSLKEIIKVYKPHIVHTHAAKAGAIGRLAAASMKVPVILHTFHGHVFHSYFNPVVTKGFILAERYLASKSSRIIAISESQKNELATEFKICKPGKIVTIPNGIDLDRFRYFPAHYREEWRKKFEVREDEIAVGIIGRLTAIKNHNFFIDIVEEVRKRAPMMPVRFFIIGDGEGRPQIITYLESKGISYNYFPENPVSADKTITLTSWEKDMSKVYAGLDVVALTSLNEGTPITLMESFAAGKPAVATNVGGVKDVILGDSSGYLIAQKDLHGFADALLLLLNDPERRAQMGKAGQDYVIKKYSYQRLASDMEALYSRLLAENHIQ